MAALAPNPDRPPAFVRASAYSAEESALLGTPRGLVPHGAPWAGSTGEPTPPAANLAADSTGLGPRSRFRFQSTGAEREVAPPSNLTSNPATSRRAGAVRKRRGRMRRRHWLALFAVGTTSLASGYWFGLPLLTRIGAGEDPSSSIRWSPSERARLTPILAAESSSRPWEMADLLRRLNATTSPAGGTPLLEARAAIAARSHAEAEIRLLRTRREGTADAGEIAFLRASNFCAQRRYDDMRASLDDAIAADPMRAEFHFARGEVDRRQGRPNDAMEGYARAIERAKPGRVPTRETIAFRRRLLLIQSGHESEIGIAEVEAALALPSPSGDWLLTAAAMAIHRQDLADAARWMQRARTVMPLPLYLDRVDDFAFRKHISQSELKALFPTRQERARFHEISRPIFVDP